MSKTLAKWLQFGTVSETQGLVFKYFMIPFSITEIVTSSFTLEKLSVTKL